MFFRAELPVLGLDIYENGKLCYELFFPYDQPRFPSCRLIILYYISLIQNKRSACIFCIYFAIHLPPVEEGEFLLAPVKISKIRKNSMCPNGMLMKRESDSLPRRLTIACQGKLSGSLHLRSLSSQSEFNQYHFAFLYESKIWFGAYPSYIGSKSLASCPQSGHV